MKRFEIYDSPLSDYSFIGFNSDGLFDGDPTYLFTSSYHVLGARLLGVSYPDFLRFCQSKGAKLRGKSGYCYPVWDRKKSQAGLLEIIKMLNTNWTQFEKVCLNGKF